MNDDKEKRVKGKNKDNKKAIEKSIQNINKDKCLYICESKIDAYEYKQMTKYFPDLYWTYVLGGTLINLVFSSIFGFSNNFLSTFIFFMCIQIFLMILYKIKLEDYAEKSFNKMKEQGLSDIEFHTEFYADYFIRQGKTETFRINYHDIDKCVENDTNFYLKYGKKNKIIVMQKKQCNEELIGFIRKTFQNMEKYIKYNHKMKKSKNYSNPNFIKKGMSVLFVITIVSFWLAVLSFSLVNQMVPHYFLNQFKNMWVFWCWLPIPIISIILGFKFNKVEFKCTKNIVSGFIVGILLIIFGAFSLIPIYSVDYKEIDSYRNVIDAKLPDNGELVIENLDTCYGEDKTECTIINSYYSNEDVSDLINSIENSGNWFLSTEIKSTLSLMIPSWLYEDEDAYFSIYNKTTNQYNTLPEVSGKYEIYTMKYDKSEKHLEIYKFKYSYK